MSEYNDSDAYDSSMMKEIDIITRVLEYDDCCRDKTYKINRL